MEDKVYTGTSLALSCNVFYKVTVQFVTVRLYILADEV